MQPVSVAAKHNQVAKFAVAASGSATLTYQWYFQGNALPGETDPVLIVLADDPSVAGDYKVRVTNNTGFVDSSVATLSIPNTAPVATEDLATTNEDTALAFDVSAFAVSALVVLAARSVFLLESTTAVSTTGATAGMPGFTWR